MSKERLAYLLFVVTATAQLGALVLVGDTRFNNGGIVVMIVLAAWLGLRSRAAWWLFVVGNAWLLLERDRAGTGVQCAARDSHVARDAQMGTATSRRH
jgi:hypothetical protein